MYQLPESDGRLGAVPAQAHAFEEARWSKVVRLILGSHMGVVWRLYNDALKVVARRLWAGGSHLRLSSERGAGGQRRGTTSCEIAHTLPVGFSKSHYSPVLSVRLDTAHDRRHER